MKRRRSDRGGKVEEIVDSREDASSGNGRSGSASAFGASRRRLFRRPNSSSVGDFCSGGREEVSEGTDGGCSVSEADVEATASSPPWTGINTDLETEPPVAVKEPLAEKYSRRKMERVDSLG